MKTDEVIKILEENKLTSVGKKVKPTVIHTETFSCANDHPIVFYAFDKTNKAMCEYCATHFVYEPPKTYSEEMQDKIEPIDTYVNKILKGSG